ncbi:VOC family protein [Enterovibrio sp. ZSDZ42]|uniref:VOC family protein n=1 Tax=Enterovibrio gelatinilyticus TaxID=2899819 RepID=A0ABT5QW60_9GAMM|nr:VOC family protein [Enterovibrio sp. ZSDZ42]MDD1792246.1 VOC family protein [Enterovibrio sp. ZSDZ42]
MSVISHITLGTNDYERASAFYDAVLQPLGLTRVPKPPGKPPLYAKDDQMPFLYIYKPIDGRPATWGNGTHVAFKAETREAVDEFYVEALANGGADEGAPGLRDHFGPNYYAAYVRDPDGNKLQAVCYGESDS